MLATFFVVEKENGKGVSSGFFVSNTWNLVVQKKDVLDLVWKKFQQNTTTLPVGLF
jgi:capsular polysaccharide biosynthesis protein